MADFGHVKISRKAYATDRFWSEKREFSKWEAWEWLIQAAAWKAHKRVVGMTALDLERGELLASLRYLAEAWGWSVKKVRNFLALLVEMERIRAQRETQQGIVYLLVNYTTYQGDSSEEGTPRAQQGHTEGTPRAQREAVKAGKAGQSDIQMLRASEEIDPDLLVNGIIRAANAGMIDNPAIPDATLRPIPIGHGTSRQLARDWLDAGIPWQTAVEGVYYAALEYAPNDRHRQVTSLAYFDNPVRDRHELAASAAVARPQRTNGVALHPDAEATRIRSEMPGAERRHATPEKVQPLKLARLFEEMQKQGFPVPLQPASPDAENVA